MACRRPVLWWLMVLLPVAVAPIPSCNQGIPKLYGFLSRIRPSRSRSTVEDRDRRVVWRENTGHECAVGGRVGAALNCSGRVSLLNFDRTLPHVTSIQDTRYTWLHVGWRGAPPVYGASE